MPVCVNYINEILTRLLLSVMEYVTSLFLPVSASVALTSVIGEPAAKFQLITVAYGAT